MTVGFLVEGLPDIQVLSYLAKRISPGIKIRPRALGNKSQLIASCGAAAKLLLEEGCNQVVIIWDLYPDSRRRTKQRKRGQKHRQAKQHSCNIDCEQIMTSLQTAGAVVSKVDLVCIDAMLETWLLIDHRGLRDFLLSKGRTS